MAKPDGSIQNLARRLRGLENRLMNALRDPRSADVLNCPTRRFSASALGGHRFILLVTTRRDGRQTATPMWFAADGERRLFTRSGASDPKLKRIRRHPEVTVAPCSFRGRPLAAPMRARARVLEDPEAAGQAEVVLKRALGWKRDLYSFVRKPLLPMAYIEIVPGDSIRRMTQTASTGAAR